MRLRGIQQHEVKKWWLRVASLLKPAVDKNDGYAMEDVLNQLLLRNCQLWVAYEEEQDIQVALVTQILIYPQHRACLLLFLGGKDRKNWLELLPYIEVWARQNGCTQMEIYGRKGWQKDLPSYQTDEIVYRKRIGEQ